MPYEKVDIKRLKTMLGRIRTHIYEPLADLRTTAWVTAEPVGYEERTSGRQIELSPGDRWGGLWDCAWFRFAGKVPEEAAGAKVVLLIDVNGELCLVDREGSPVQGLTTVNSEFDFSLGLPGKRVVDVSGCAAGGEEIDLWGDAGCNDLFGHYRGGTLKEAVVARCRDDVRELYYDAEVLLETAELLPESSARKEQLLRALYEASLLLTELSGERVAAARKLLGAQLAKRGGDPTLTVSAVGHAHIDLAWLWPIRETIRKGARTFATALRMMEKYPDYVFGASQPQLYDWIKRRHPALYGRVKERVREGRWEPQGAMWVESDTNVPGGESLVRQLLYGKRFFREEFGRELKMLWMPDVFGYSASLPQILKKSGVDYMMTQKLSWSAYNRYPHHTFMWEGIDGSRVLTHMPPEDTYNSPAAPRSLLKIEADYLDRGVSDRCLMLFGIGDGGGGPGEEHLERLSREKNLLGLSPVVQETAERFFERLAEGQERYRQWSGELYLEKHQGTLTSQARSKRFNRKLEKALRELEFAAVLAGLAVGFPYPAEELEEIWKEVLLYQFHDILPGSSIKRVYDESLERYGILLERVERMIDGAYGAVAGALPFGGAEKRFRGEEAGGVKPQETVKAGSAGMRAGAEDRAERKKAAASAGPALAEDAPTVAVFNSLPWERDEWLKLDGRWIRMRVPAMGGASAPRGEPPEDGPAATETAAAAALPSSAEAYDTAPPGGGLTIENDLLAVTFAADGMIRSIRDKELNREAVAEGGRANDLRVYPDDGDAWDFPHDYRSIGGEAPTLEDMAEFRDGPTAGCVMRYRIGRSLLVQTVVLTQGSRRIDFRTEADWQESGRMLRAAFPLRIRAGSVTCEIQFGSLKRPTHRNTLWDYAKDEICAHHWIDLSEPDYGVALLNDCKYGHSATGGTLELNLLRSPSHPDPEADRAGHSFTYSLYPHPGNHAQAEVYKRGYELNVPLRAVRTARPMDGADGVATEAAGEVPGAACAMLRGPLLRPEHPNVMVEAVKRAEDGDGIIVRLYETAGTSVQTRLAVGFPLASAQETDLMETPIGRLSPDNGSVPLALQPFEIKTVRLVAASL